MREYYRRLLRNSLTTKEVVKKKPVSIFALIYNLRHFKPNQTKQKGTFLEGGESSPAYSI
jgi:hypothetical protein